MAVRLSRSERKERTRSELLAAARAVFLREGFHRAALEQIAEEAGFTKGAVYSNFRGKDDLFLALLEEHYEQRVAAHRRLLAELELRDLEETRRGIARAIYDAYERDPGWWALVADFSTHASRDPHLRSQLRGLREQFLAGMAELIEVVAARHHVAFPLTSQEVARGTGALLRGLMLDWILDPEGADRAVVFEEMVAAFLRGLAFPLDGRRTP
jgi:AcrR family transcriptional regulator